MKLYIKVSEVNFDEYYEIRDDVAQKALTETIRRDGVEGAIDLEIREERLCVIRGWRRLKACLDLGIEYVWVKVRLFGNENVTV